MCVCVCVCVCTYSKLSIFVVLHPPIQPNYESKVFLSCICPGMVVQIYNSSYLGGRRKRISSLRPDQGKVSEALSPKQSTNKRPGGVAQVVECLPSMLTAKDRRTLGKGSTGSAVDNCSVW
jgi:hypothetical protein